MTNDFPVGRLVGPENPVEKPVQNENPVENSWSRRAQDALLAVAVAVFGTLALMGVGVILYMLGYAVYGYGVALLEHTAITLAATVVGLVVWSTAYWLIRSGRMKKLLFEEV